MLSLRDSTLVGCRLDCACVQLGIAQTRNQASMLIKTGKVCVNGIPILKTAYRLSLKDSISALERQCFVSRAGEKLYRFLQQYPIFLESIQGVRVLDIGASTGGFTQVLLQEGAQGVVCVDVGREQLHRSLLQDARVESYENMDIRSFAKEHQQKFSCIVCDVSFISVKEILQAICKLSMGLVILLFKPQFEVGRAIKRNKKGVVQDKNAIKESLENLLAILIRNGFEILANAESQLKGKEGNAEFFIACQKS